MTKPAITQYEWKGRKLRHLPTGRQWTWGSDFITRGSELTPDGRDFDAGELDAMAVKLMAKKAYTERWQAADLASEDLALSRAGGGSCVDGARVANLRT